MTLAAEFLELSAELIAEFGSTASLVIPTAVYSTDGTVSETPTTVSVTIAGPVDEAKRYAATGADTRVTGTFYLSASGLTVAPTTGCRIVYGGRTFSIVACLPYSIQGTLVAYRLDVGEVGA